MVIRSHTRSATVEADLAGAVAQVVLRGEFGLTTASLLEEMLALVRQGTP